MPKQDQPSRWVPEIMYEEASEGLSSHIPFIQVPTEEDMPRMLFIFESRETGEFEPGPNGEDLPVTELDLHQYADMAILKDNLTPPEYDNELPEIEVVAPAPPLPPTVLPGAF